MRTGTLDEAQHLVWPVHAAGWDVHLGMFLLSQFRNMDLLRYISYFKAPATDGYLLPTLIRVSSRCHTELFCFRMEHLKRKKRKYVIISKACGGSDRNDLTANCSQQQCGIQLGLGKFIEKCTILTHKMPTNRFVMSYNSRNCYANSA